LKWEFNFVDNLNKAAALSTDQIDIENAERYGITYTDKNGKKKYPIILHCSPSGAIERCIYALLEKAYSEQKNGKIPKLPLWLSPTQVRIIPVSNKFLKESEKIASELEKNYIRVDIDDREETVSKKIREAEIEWVPIICVIGSKEVKEKIITARIRERKEVKEMKLEKLIEMIKEEIKEKPFKPLSLPKYLSKRAIFVS
jgi:threonyl-tRNA synthetase